MSLEVWTIYVATILVLMITPGPSQLLMASNSATNGLRRSLATVAGDLTANVLQMLAAGLGLAAIISTYGYALFIVKWFGAACLVWLGIGRIRNAARRSAANAAAKPSSLNLLWLQGFLTSASNPKAIVFFAALFPQFISSGRPFWVQFSVLAITYIIVDGLFLMAYGAGARSLTRRFAGTMQSNAERVGGSLLIGAGILLAVKSLRQS